MAVQARNAAVPYPSDALRYAQAIRVAWDRTDPDRDRLRAFQQLARRLSGCLDRAEVAEAVFHLGLALVHADEATISVLASPDEVEILYAHGDVQPAYQPHARLRLRDWRPGADAVTTRAPVWLESPREIQARYPELEPFRARWSHSAWVLVPLVMDERAVGLLGLVYHRRHRFDASERSYIVALADQCAQALHRAMLVTAEAESRRRAEAAEQVASRTAARVTLGDEVTDALAEANTEAEVTRVVFAKAVEVLGAVAGIVTRRTVDDELEVVEVLGAREEAPGPSDRLERGGPHAEVFRTKRPLCLGLRAGAGWMGVPLSVRGELSGTLSLTISSMPVDDVARASLLRLVEQCGRALSRARLLESERAARRAAEAAEAETRRLGKLQEQFVAVVAHDLRTPLGAIQLTVKTLFGDGAPSEAQSRKVGRIFASVERIAEILRTLCDFSQARLAGGIPLLPERVDLGRLARRAVAEMEGAHPERRIEVSLDGDLGMVGDGGRLLQVFSNLLGNALQHGASETPVAVRVRGEGAAIVIDVHNDGPPIPPALLPSLFEPYRQGEASHASAKRTGSMGLGLFIVHEVVHAHGGAVSVDSRPERGTTFTVVVPRLTSPPAPPRAAPTPRSELRR